MTPDSFNKRSAGHLPGLVGLTILSVTPDGLECCGDHRGRGQENRPVPLHPVDPLARVDKAPWFVLE
jgi:hypothetical protein